MITEKQYLKAKKVIADYESQQLNKPVVIGSKPKPKPKTKKTGESFFESWDKVIKNIKL
jgi:hypothetical protein